MAEGGVCISGFSATPLATAAQCAVLGGLAVSHSGNFSWVLRGSNPVLRVFLRAEFPELPFCTVFELGKGERNAWKTLFLLCR